MLTFSKTKIQETWSISSIDGIISKIFSQCFVLIPGCLSFEISWISYLNLSIWSHNGFRTFSSSVGWGIKSFLSFDIFLLAININWFIASSLICGNGISRHCVLICSQSPTRFQRIWRGVNSSINFVSILHDPCLKLNDFSWKLYLSCCSLRLISFCWISLTWSKASISFLNLGT